MLIPVILSGGAGTRLWPVSREMHPKPFMHLSDGESLLQRTFSRAAHLNHANQILTVTNREYFFKTKDEYAAISKNEHSIDHSFLLEPFGRNTAPAIAMAAFYAQEKFGEDSVLLILPADHLVGTQKQFGQIVEFAYQLAQQNKLVTFGIKPTYPATGYGYIKGSEKFGAHALNVEKFVEKPALTIAEDYVNSGDYYWNSGMFCFKAGTLLDQLKTLSPDIFNACLACWQKSKTDSLIKDSLEIDSESFQLVPDLSIDYAIMEKSNDVLVIPCEFDWNDIGSWDAVGDLVEADAAGNRLTGETILVDVKNSFIQGGHRLVAAIGVENLAVIDTPDALLITTRERVQDVKLIVNQLKKDNHESYKLHRTVHRPWGTYTILEEGKHFKIKRITVKPGASLSLQKHQHRSEHWVVIQGTAKVTNGDNVLTLKIDESTFIPAGHVHRLENSGPDLVEIIEVQTGSYLGEDDIVRLEDRYDRK